MKIIPLNQGQQTIVDDDIFALYGHLKWQARLTIKGKLYAARNVTIKGKRTSEQLHRLILGLPHGDRRKADHVSLDTLDNRKENLRIPQGLRSSSSSSTELGMTRQLILYPVASLDAKYIEPEAVSAMRRQNMAAYLMTETGDFRLEYVITENGPDTPGQWFELGHRWNRFGPDLILTRKTKNFYQVEWRTPGGWLAAPDLMTRKDGASFAFGRWLEDNDPTPESEAEKGRHWSMQAAFLAQTAVEE